MFLKNIIFSTFWEVLLLVIWIKINGCDFTSKISIKIQRRPICVNHILHLFNFMSWYHAWFQFVEWYFRKLFFWPSFCAEFSCLTDKTKYTTIYYIACIDFLMNLTLWKYYIERKFLTCVHNCSILDLSLTCIVLYFSFEFTQPYFITSPEISQSYLR